MAGHPRACSRILIEFPPLLDVLYPPIGWDGTGGLILELYPRPFLQGPGELVGKLHTIPQGLSRCRAGRAWGRFPACFGRAFFRHSKNGR